MEHAEITVAILAGGYSSEYNISLASGRTAEAAFIEAGMKVIFVELRKEGFYVNEEKVKLTDLEVDYVFNSIHGTPGEDGHISGMLEVFGLPHSTCSTFESALTFNKAKCNAFLRDMGYRVPKGASFTEIPELDHFKSWNFPLFVKPNRSGSSFGVSRIERLEELPAAFAEALKEDHEIVVEEGVIGTEVGCGVVSLAYDLEHNTKLDRTRAQAIAITEIVPTESAFFDYQAKYDGKSQEITPARIAPEVSKEIENLSTAIYERLELRGIVRLDFIVNKDNEPVLIEINSIPGMSPASIIPQQVRYRNWSLSNILALGAKEHIAAHKTRKNR
ncbi:MAG: hypothetical protein RL754_98 [Bacteroidota bacterium]|jgi:D-alanine-D-alanine ligase